MIEGLPIALAWVVAAWLLSLARRDAGVVDLFWGSGFAVLAWSYRALADPATPRGLILALLVSKWGLRLTAHIFARNRGKGEDYRYREMREKHGPRFPGVSLFTVFLLQGTLLWLIAAPLYVAQQNSAATALSWIDGLAAAVFAIGLAFEAIGDRQLARFRADARNAGRVLDSGLWRYTRHPNYFGDALVWWGFWLFAVAAGSGLATLYSPLLMTFLLIRVSGVTLLEKKLSRTRPGYSAYVQRTSSFVPWFPRSITLGSRFRSPGS